MSLLLRFRGFHYFSLCLYAFPMLCGRGSRHYPRCLVSLGSPTVSSYVHVLASPRAFGWLSSLNGPVAERGRVALHVYRTMLVALQFESGLIFLCSNHISFVSLRQVYVCSLSVCYVPVLFPPVFSTRTRPRALGGFPAVSSVFSFVGAFHHRAGGFWCTLSFDFCTIPPFRVRSALARLACQTMFAQPLGSGPNRKVGSLV